MTLVSRAFTAIRALISRRQVVPGVAPHQLGAGDQFRAVNRDFVGVGAGHAGLEHDDIALWHGAVYLLPYQPVHRHPAARRVQRRVVRDLALQDAVLADAQALPMGW